MKQCKWLVGVMGLFFLVGGCSLATDFEFSTDVEVDTDSETPTDSDAVLNCPEDNCAVGGVCVPDGELNPSNICQVCDVSLAGSAWSDNDGQVCSDFNACTTPGVCDQGICAGSDPIDCSGFADDCNLAACNAATGCYADPEPFEGSECDDGDGCTLARCRSGQCTVEEDYVFWEDFHTDDGSWDVGAGEWEIGVAQSAICSVGSDPPTDRTPLREDNGLAGVALGGCMDVSTPHGFDCLTSPVLDLSTLSRTWLQYWAWLGAEADDKMHHELQIDDGTGFVILSGTPSLVSDDGWRWVRVDVSEFRSSTVQIRWCNDVTNTSNIASASSWNIDDVIISSQQYCIPDYRSCGNGMVDGEDECDGTELDDQDCTTIPGSFTGGILTCSEDCTFDTSNCI